MALAMEAADDDEDDEDDDAEEDDDGEHEWGTRRNSPNQRHICPLSPFTLVHDSASQYPTQLVFVPYEIYNIELLSGKVSSEVW
ncbi:hypothetical protein VE04_08698 [Pseudogymnoascus sp. 24MN13]|nr:hypothetical protein VE04_08698 [Pseudogymnoascus sp. 24MN13]